MQFQTTDKLTAARFVDAPSMSEGLITNRYAVYKHR